MDMSHLDKKYFISENIYNCPFCNRKHVSYRYLNYGSFDWSNQRVCYFFIAECRSCEKKSFHLSDTNFAEFDDYSKLDDIIFLSVPSSFFTVDERIPNVLRELFAEAEGCLKSNFLTGASACARKVVYELAKREEAEGEDYTERLKSLKKKLPHIDADYFDTLIDVKDTTSSKVHENASDAWESGHLRLILSTLIEVLNEIYVVPKVKEEKRAAIKKLREETLPPKSTATAPPPDNVD